MLLDYSSSLHYLLALLPEAVLAAFAMWVLLAGVSRRRSGGLGRETGWLALAGLLVAGVANGWLYSGVAEGGTAAMIAVDRLRPLRQLGLHPRRGLRDRRRAPLRGATEAAGGRVLLARTLRDGRHDGHGGVARPDAHLPRPRADVDRGLRACGVQPPGPQVRRGRTEVLPPRRLRERVPALRDRAPLRGRGEHQPPRHIGGAHRRCGRGGSPRSRSGSPHDRPRLQGLGGALPHVDARRLRGCADPGDGLHGRGRQGGRLRGPPADLRDRARRPARRMVRDPLVGVCPDDGLRQPWWRSCSRV